jgi:hypothetical protein
MTASNALPESPPETEDGDGKASLFVIKEAELFGRIFAQGIEGFTCFSEKARVVFCHWV